MNQFEFWGAQAELQGFLADNNLVPFSDFTVESDSGNAEIKAVLKVDNDQVMAGLMKTFARVNESGFRRVFYSSEKNSYTFKKML